MSEQMYPNFNANPMPPQNESNGMAIASLVCGIIGVCCCGGAVGLILGILAIVFGVLGKKKPSKQGLATAGLILGIVALVLFVVVLIIAQTEWYQQLMSDMLGDEFAKLLG